MSAAPQPQSVPRRLEDDPVRRRDGFFSLQLVPIIMLPTFVRFVADIMRIFGVDQNTLEILWAPYLLVSAAAAIGTFGIIIIAYPALIVYIIAVNVYRKKFRLLASCLLLLILPITTRYLDINYLRFSLRLSHYENVRLRDERTASDGSFRCFLLDSFTDRFYLGAAAFDPYDLLVVYDGSDEIARPETERSQTWLARAKPGCPDMRALHYRRPLKGHYHLVQSLDPMPDAQR